VALDAAAGQLGAARWYRRVRAGIVAAETLLAQLVDVALGPVDIVAGRAGERRASPEAGRSLYQADLVAVDIGGSAVELGHRPEKGAQILARVEGEGRLADAAR
jgi:hypothetical protein